VEIELSLKTYLIVCPLVFLGGLVDAIAGGGGLISLQAYLLTGIPMHTSLATNKLSAIMGTATASYRYYKNRYVDLLLCLPSIAAALGGSALGTSLTLIVDERYLQKILLLVLPVTAFYVFKNRRFDARPDPLPRPQAVLYSAIISFFIGAYDGFFGPGTGTFLILLYTGIVKLDPRTASGNAKCVNLASNLASMTVFLFSGRTLIPLGLCAGAFSVLGGYIGSGLAINRGGRIIRVFILVILALLFTKIAWDIISAAMA
jgi:uncharacterized membrane protein YfcA